MSGSWSAKQSPCAWSEAMMLTSRVPPSLEGLLSRGGTRPLFGSRALRSPLGPDLWLCVPASRPVCLCRKNASTVLRARSVPLDLSRERVPKPQRIMLSCVDGPRAPSVRFLTCSIGNTPSLDKWHEDLRDQSFRRDCGKTSGFRTLLQGRAQTGLGLDGARDSDWDGPAR